MSSWPRSGPDSRSGSGADRSFSSTDDAVVGGSSDDGGAVVEAQPSPQAIRQSGDLVARPVGERVERRSPGALSASRRSRPGAARPRSRPPAESCRARPAPERSWPRRGPAAPRGPHRKPPGRVRRSRGGSPAARCGRDAPSCARRSGGAPRTPATRRGHAGHAGRAAGRRAIDHSSGKSRRASSGGTLLPSFRPPSTMKPPMLESVQADSRAVAPARQQGELLGRGVRDAGEPHDGRRDRQAELRPDSQADVLRRRLDDPDRRPARGVDAQCRQSVAEDPEDPFDPIGQRALHDVLRGPARR